MQLWSQANRAFRHLPWGRNWLQRAIIVMLVCCSLPVGAFPVQAQQGPTMERLRIDASTIMTHVRVLSEDIGARPTGSRAELDAAAYIRARFEAWGYIVREQEFTAVAAMNAIVSRNIIAYHPDYADTVTGALIVGAHYDSVTAGTGAGDNASGVAVMLAVAEALATQSVMRPVVFVAFGAEEAGKHGSEFFVERLTPDDIASLYAMVNVDTVGAGDHLYAYAGTASPALDYTDAYVPGPIWARDQVLTLGAELGIPVRTSPATSWNGFTGTWSDHAAFAVRGVPVVYLERWNWDVGSDPNWGQETAQGDILHTSQDTLASVDPAKLLPVAELLGAFVVQSALSPVS